MRCSSLVAAALLLGGCGSPNVRSLATVREVDLPADPTEVERRAEAYELAGDAASLEDALVVREHLLSIEPGAYDHAWRAARTTYRLAEASALDGEMDRRRKFAARGVALARRAVAIRPAGGEAHYYLAGCLGLLASTKTLGAIDLLPEMAEEARRAIAVDERIDHGGPRRMLGALLVRAPGWPTSIGDTEEGLDHLRRAVAIDPDYPPNRLYFAQGLVADDHPAAARQELERVIRMEIPPEWRHDAVRWRAEAASLLEDIR